MNSSEPYELIVDDGRAVFYSPGSDPLPDALKDHIAEEFKRLAEDPSQGKPPPPPFVQIGLYHIFRVRFETCRTSSRFFISWMTDSEKSSLPTSRCILHINHHLFRWT